MLRKVLAVTALVGGFVFAMGCAPEVGNNGDVVGGPCVVSSECSFDSQCRTGEEFPMGMCGNLCDSDADCPDGSVCTGDGNFCMVACDSASDCREDDGYTCTTRDARGETTGDVMVCATVDD